jgi:ABC-type transport system involved in multi-copper enzyme maturation permease subunit
MTAETTAAPAAPPVAKKRSRTLREFLTRNPVLLKELRGRMRGARAFVVLTLNLVLMSGFVMLIYTVYAAAANAPYGGTNRQMIGKFVFYGVVGMELLIVCFLAPAFTVGAISGERERQTFDLLRTTLLSARALVFGKLTSALSYVLLLLLAGLPLQSLAFLLGGVAPEEVIISTVMLITTAFLFCSAGLFFSSLMRRTLGANILTYAFALLDTLGLPILLLAALPIFGFMSYGYGYGSPPRLLVQLLFAYGLGALISVNPVATAIMTEVFLVDKHTVFYFTYPFTTSSGSTFDAPFVSPWIVFTVFGLVLGALFVFLSIRLVRRAER